MRNYNKQIEKFGKEIADEILEKEKNPSYLPCLDVTDISRSIARIHNTDLGKTMEDLEDSISKEIIKRRQFF